MILTDTGYWLALANPQDRHHPRALLAVQQYAYETLICTWPVVTETFYLLSTRLHLDAALRFMDALQRGACKVLDLPPDALTRMVALQQRYRNLPMDVADASLVILAEELGEGRILSTDSRDFESYRWKARKPFKNLLLD